MSARNPHRRQVNQYDKILKENLEISLPEMIRELLGLQIVDSEELPDDVQHTKERKPDALKRVTDEQGNTYVLHIEFQLEDEREMVYRMLEYSSMLSRKYKLPVKQYVLFLKDVEATMPVELTMPDLAFRYTLIQIAKIDYRVFLRSQHPEVKILGILANFNGTPPKEALESILLGVFDSSIGDFVKSRNSTHMRIFVEIRKNLALTYDEVMESISKYFKEEDDLLYKKGITKGEARGIAKGEAMVEEARHVFVKNLILKRGFSDEQAADTAEVSLEYVEKIRTELNRSENKRTS